MFKLNRWADYSGNVYCTTSAMCFHIFEVAMTLKLPGVGTGDRQIELVLSRQADEALLARQSGLLQAGQAPAQ